MGIKQQARLEGKLKYNNGKLCPQGHASDRLVSNGKCIKCARVEQSKNRRFRKFKKYGLSKELYFELFWKQAGKCAICREKETVINKTTGQPVALAVDHCHDNKKIRGLLCNQCNIGIGNLKHNPDLLRIAALYCEKD